MLISLCVAGLAVAAPQLDLPGVQRTVTTVVSNNDVNEDTLVNNVVSALEPSIALAVANALRSLQTTSTTTTLSGGGGALFEGGVSAGQSSSSSFSASSSAAAKSSSSAAKSAAAEKAAFEKEFAAGRVNEEPTTRPEYNFEFKVADGEEQTYITQQESRDGDELTGSYSYVDPEGSLITVTYQAGPEGFSQTTDKQEGFIQIVPRPPRIAAISATAGGASAASSSGKFSSSSAASGASKGGASFSSQTASTSSSSSVDQSALIAQILAALQPQISASVNAALTASQSRTTSSIINVPAAPVAVAAAPVALAARPVQAAARPVQAAASGNLASLFGDGYAVRIATPEFKIEY